jgi:hypothetical protein
MMAIAPIIWTLNPMAISVVTCCKNRNDHLALTVRQWLARDWVRQVVIVDWSSTIPVAETLRDVPKDKISIVRAEGESEWILTLAYNLGIVHATGDMILKADADCLVGDRVRVDCQPDDAAFFAGNLRAGNPRGKPASVNGQCFFTRRAFEIVNGYNELLRGWGQDDEDFYDRLADRGFARHDIDCDLFDFIDHPIDARMDQAPKIFDSRPAQHLLEQQVTVQDWKNCVVAAQMPWGKWFPRARYRYLGAEGAVTHVERRRDLEVTVPKAVLEKARLEAGRTALRQLGIDTGGTEPEDYTAVVDIFERWVIANFVKPDPAGRALHRLEPPVEQPRPDVLTARRASSDR